MFREHRGNTISSPDERSPAAGDAVRLGGKPRKPLIRTLEPRMVFDAAAAVTAHHAIAPPQHEPGGEAAYPPVAHPSLSYNPEPTRADPVALPERPAIDVQPAPAEPVAAEVKVDHKAVPPSGEPHELAQIFDSAAPAITTEVAPKEVFFVWDNVKDWQKIVADLGDTANVHVVDSSKDGVEQIAATLETQRDIGVIHLISHGEEGRLNLGTAVLDVDSMQGRYHDDLTAIGRALSKDGDILVYGCDFAAGSAGTEAAIILGDITHADIAASTDPTGAATRGGDWDLERQTGAIEATAFSDDDYQFLLTPPVVDLDGALGATGNTAASYTENSTPVAIVATGALGAIVIDGDGDLQTITITVDAAPNGDDEYLSFNGLAIGLGSDSTNTVIVDATSYRIVYTTATGTFVISNLAGGTIPSGGATNMLLRSITYDNSSDDPTDGGAETDRVFSFTATDAASSTSAVSTATVTITAVNDPPVVADDSSTIDEDTVATGNVLANDADPDSSLQVTQFVVDDTTYTAGQTATLDGIGTLTIAADGSYTFTPDANYDGLVPVATYTVSDGSVTAIATLSIEIIPVNDLPVDGDETNVVAEDTTLTVADGETGDLLGNASDVEGGALTISAFSVAGQVGPFVIGSAYTIAGVGAITINANGSYVFAPAPDYTGAIPVITYTVADGAGGTDSSTLTLSIVSVNDAPAGNDNTVTFTEDTTYTFSAASFGFTDPGDTPANALQAVIITTLPPSADGVLLLAGVAVTAGQTIPVAELGNLTFQPAADVFGSSVGAFTFQVVDDGGIAGGGEDTDQSPNSFAFDITNVNDAPVATDDTTTTPEDTTLNGNVLDNDTDVDGDTLTVTQFSTLNVTATAGQTGTIPDVGQITINADGSYVFVPVANFIGPVPVITYTISDGNGGTDTATLNIEVISVNDPPVDGNETNGVTEDTTLNVADGAAGDLLGNSSDLDGDVLSITDYTVPGVNGGNPIAAGTATLIPGVGTITIGANGSYTFVPLANYDGAIPVITYTVSDGNGGTDTSTLTLSMTPVNDAPVAIDDATTTPENSPVSGNVLGNDSDVDNPTLTVTFFQIDGTTYGAGTTVPISGVGTLTINPDGSYVFTPAPSYSGPVPSATYTVSDGILTDTAVLTITIVPINDPPVAENDSGTTPEDTTLTVPAGSGLLVGDTDADGDPLTITEFTVAGDPTVYTAGDTATIAGVGELTINADGSYTFVPAPNYNGPVPVATYTVSDGNSGTDQGTLTLDVTPVNDPPVAADDTGTTPEDTPLGGNVLTNDTDGDTGDTLTVVGFSVNGNTFVAGATATLPQGTVTLNADGSYTLVPAANYTGPVPVITYVVSDGNGGVDTGTLTLVVTPINDPPVAVDDNATTSVDTGVSGNVLDNDTDVDGDPIVVTEFTDADGNTYQPGETANLPEGDLTINSDGSYTFVPAPGYVGPVPDVDYTISDGTETDQGTLHIDIIDVGLGANDDAVRTPEDTTLGGNVLANDVSSDGSQITLVSFTVGGNTYQPGDTASLAEGDLTINADGSYTFEPAPDYFGPVPLVTYTATDGAGTDTATLSITVTPENDPAMAIDDTGTTPEDRTLSGNVLANDTDVDGALTVTEFEVAGITFTAGQTASIPTIGQLTINANGRYTFVPFANYTGPVPPATYTISDGSVTTTATLTITVTPVNDAPVGVNDTNTIAEDTVATGNVLGNDTDVEGAALTVTGFVWNGSTYSAGQTATVAGVGQLTIAANGNYTFTPIANYNGNPPVAAYTLSDGSLTASATLTITVTPVNDAPDATDDTATLAEDATLTVSAGQGLLSNDRDIENAALSVEGFEVAGIFFGAGTTATIPGVGSLTINADGSYTFTPVLNFNGSVPDVTYRISDGNLGTDTAVLRIIVTPVNDVPVDGNETNSVTEDTTLTVSNGAAGDLLNNATDIDGDPLTITGYTIAGISGSQPVGSPVSIAGVGTLIINADGSYSFTPAADYTGSVPVITYTVSDGALNDTSTLTLTITPVNDPPIAVDDIVSTPEDTTLNGNVLGNDVDVDGDALSIDLYSVVGLGGFLPGAPAIIAGVGTLTINADGSYTFVPVANYNGPVPLVTYRIVDANGVQDTGDLIITVTPVNDPPVDGNETNSVTEDTRLTVPVASGLLVNTTDIDGGTPTVSAFTVAGQAGPFTIGRGYLIVGVGTITINGNGSYSFAPAANYTGAIPAITYTVSDGAGGTDTSTLTLTMVPVNDPPVDGNETNSVTEDTTLSVGAASGLLANTTDIDGGAPTVTGFTAAGQAGPFTIGSGYLIAGVGTITINANGSYSFAPAANYTGAIPVITYTVSDGAGGTDTSTLTLTMVPVNDPPVDGNETNSVTEDTTLTVANGATGDLLNNATDIDGGRLTISGFTIAGQPGPFTIGSGYLIAGVGTVTINGNGSYTFAPAANYTGAIPVITYTVSDGAGGTDTSTLTLTMVPVNDPPVDGNETNSVTEDTTLTVAAASGLLANTTDIDGGAPTVTDFTVAGQSGPFTIGSGYLIAGVGTITINANGSYSFAPAANYTGAIPVITYTVSDGAGGTDTSTLTLTMVPVNDPPIALDDTGTTSEDTVLTGNVLTNDTDIDGGVPRVNGFVVAGITYNAGETAVIGGVGTLTIGINGNYRFVPAPDYNGLVPVATYTMTDGRGGTDTATLSISVTPVNDPPRPDPDRGSLPPQTSVDSRPIVPVLVSQHFFDVDGDALTYAASGLPPGLSIDPATGIIQGTLPNNASQGSPYVVLVTATDPSGLTGRQVFTWAVNNPAPIASDDTASGAEETVVTGTVLGNDRDPDGDDINVSRFAVGGNIYTAGQTATLAGIGTLVIGADGTYVFTPVLNYNGAVPTAIYTLVDADGSIDTATLRITVTPVDDVPQLVDDRASGNEDTPVTGNVLANDSDPDGDTLTVTGFGIDGDPGTYLPGETAAIPGVGSISLNADGSFIFNPEPNYDGPVPAITYTASDGNGGTAQARLFITILPIDDFVPTPDEIDPDLPFGPDIPYDPENVDGAVVEAVQAVNGLDNIDELGERHPEASPRFLLRTFLGGSSTVVIDRPGASDEKIHIETIKHAGIIYLQLVEEKGSDESSAVLSYRLSGPDGAMAPVWLRQIGPYTFAGQPEAGSGFVDLVLSIGERDGQVYRYEIRLDSFTGYLSQPEQSEDHGAKDGTAPMFSQQLGEQTGGQDATRLARALGLF